ncbi:MAG TPA: YCF48-related protein [Chloroflexota bacterium]|nr:YCF48-related protein [Chloroflexota bacterium]
MAKVINTRMVRTFHAGPRWPWLISLVIATLLAVGVSAFSATGTQAQSSPSALTPTPTPGARPGVGSIRVASCGYQSYLNVSPTTVAAGGSVTASGSCFDANDTLTFWLDTLYGTQLATQPASPPTDSSGSFNNVSVSIPADTTVGSHTIFAIDSFGDTATASLTVTAPPPSATPTATNTPTPTSTPGSGSVTWTSLTTGVPSTVSLYGVAFNGSGTVIAVGQGSEIVRSTNDVMTWQTINASNQGSFNLYSVAFADASHAWAGGQAGTLYSSSNGGINWVPVPVTDSSGKTRYPIIHGIAFTSSSVGYLAGGELLDQMLETGEIFRTTDGGMTWNLLSNVPADEQWNSITFNQAGVGLAVATNGDIIRTTDGSNWTKVFSQSYPLIQLNDVAFTTDGSTAVAVGDNAVILRSTDAGQSWTQVSPPSNLSNLVYLKGIAFSSSTKGSAVGGTGCTGCVGQTAISTSDGGATWSITYQNGATVQAAVSRTASGTAGGYFWRIGCDTAVCIAAGDAGTAISTGTVARLQPRVYVPFVVR